MEDTYRTIESPSEGLFKDKGSKFLAYVYHIESDEEIKPIIQTIKKEHFGARHHCYAYRLGANGDKYRANDDGEPSGTAGKPIHGQLLSFNVTNVLVVVVRYFGGTLLGVSGLINAYKNATADALQNANIVERLVEQKLSITFGYQDQNKVMRIVKEEQLTIEKADYNVHCKLIIPVRISKIDTITAKFSKLDFVQCEMLT